MVTMQLQRVVTSRGGRPCAKGNQREGLATTCDALGNAKRYRLAGSPQDRRAVSVLIGAVPEADPPPDGLELKPCGA
jgi:hypothetical protein